jgi:hypothetical protein
VRLGRLHEAVAALEALHLHGDSAEILQKISEAVSKRTEAELQRTFKQFFEKPSTA